MPSTSRTCAQRLPSIEPSPSETPAPLGAALPEEQFRSQIVTTIEISASALAARLAAEVPTQASATHVSVGAAGLLTYSAHRSPFSAFKRGQTLHFTTQISAQAEVCKPLGPLGCISYASCQPAALADASVGLEPDPTWALGPSHVALVMTRPCLLGPLDATPLIQRGANQQAAALRAQLNKNLPTLRPQVTAFWNAAQVRASLGQSQWHFAPVRLAVGPASLHGEVLSYPVAALGFVTPTQQAPDHDPGLPPPPSFVPSIEPRIVLHIPLDIDTKTMEQQFLSSLDSLLIRAGSSTGSVATVEVHPTVQGLLLVLEISGGLCGNLPLLLTPSWDQQLARVRFSLVRIPLPTRTALDRVLPSLDQHQLEASLQERLSLSLPWSAEALSDTLGRALESFPPKGAVSVEFSKRETSIERVVLSPTGLSVLLDLQQQARVVVR